MALADIKAKIKADSQAQIKAIEAENDDKVREISRKVNAEIKEIQDSYASRLGKEEPEVLRRREIVAELDAKRIDLGVRQRLLGEAFEAALKQMVEMAPDKYVKFADKLMSQAVSTGNETVFVGTNEKHLDQRWIDGYNASHNTSLTLSAEKLPISGGFVLRNDRIDTNCSWDMLIADTRADIETEVVKRLFA
ncbi:MAG: V-type ATP synthase subunit E [Synergistaceae bacterium]|nr:V-type ATP synthase subunit E [Synergistaceae bacterium]MBQ7067622.1 V-type ATP synthase subunit E [Synergistaceae bacterium]MBR0076366.1 V-type ATP synthase subunit E [Synergistaceae bacterium]MBR0079383.1 V-type ATP synthase subunit E [Synergistaceae bacterium]MBR0233919.1 V-type ATP synthase subunit E [Synergistaceae bacterium]